jgi:thioredoxin 1
MAPGLEAFAADNAGKVKVFKIDSDDNPKMADKYGIKSIPTVIFFKGGELVETHVGAMSQTALQSKLDELLKV